MGGALLGANSITILVKAAGAGRRGRALGIFAAAQAVGVSGGPVIGGLLLANVGWRWVFWVSVPFGIIGAVIGWLVLPKTTELADDKRFDWKGALLLTPALTSIVLVLSELQTWGLKSVLLLGMALAVALLLPLFIWHERRTVAPLIDLQLFRIPAFSGGVIAVNLSYALLYSMFFLMSFTLIRGLNESPVLAGLHLAIIPAALGLVSPISGAFYERVGARILTTAGMALCTGALVLLSLSLTGMTGHDAPMMGALALFGIGLGMFVAPNNSATMAAAPGDRSGEAGGLLNLLRVLGGAIGIAITSTALSWRLKVLTGIGDRTLGVPTGNVLAAAKDVLWVLGIFAIVAAAAALLRSRTSAGVRKS